MALAIIFRPVSMTAAQYDDVIRRLELAGAGSPPGRTYHACFGSGQKLAVFDVWESQEAFDAFGRTLMPILGEVGVDPGLPEVAPLHDEIVVEEPVSPGRVWPRARVRRRGTT
jgi:hypothetical protein